MNVQEAAAKWGITKRSVRKAVKENRVRHRVSESGEVSIPSDEIGPIPKASVQTILWIILRLKNDASWRPDFSTVPNLPSNQLQSAFKQLAHRRYIDGISDGASLADSYSECRLTEKGLELVRAKPLPGSALGKQLVNSTANFVWLQLLDRVSRLIPF